MMLDCVLFDMDGLLIDSEPLQFRAYREAFAQFGYDLGRDDWTRWHYVEASSARFIKDEGLDIDSAVVRAVKKQLYDRLIEEELELKAGARQLVESCAAEFRLALVSGSRPESIESCLQKFDLLHHFRVLVSGADLARSKPYPDAYLEAMRQLGTDGSQSIALEDSASGFRAAVAAGLPCVVCPDNFRARADDAFDDAVLVVESLEEVTPDRLRAIR